MENVEKLEIRSIQLSLSRLEQLGSHRAALMEVVGEEVKAVDEKRKVERSKVAETLGKLADCQLAVATANVIAPTIEGADDTTRKRLQRRRAWLKAALKTSYPEYDFEVTKGRNGGQFVADYIGDADIRKANRVLAEITSTFKLVGETMPEGLTAATIANAYKAERNAAPIVPSASELFGAPAKVTPVRERIEKVAEKVQKLAANA